jgi:hypothetical protein
MHAWAVCVNCIADVQLQLMLWCCKSLLLQNSTANCRCKHCRLLLLLLLLLPILPLLQMQVSSFAIQTMQQHLRTFTIGKAHKEVQAVPCWVVSVAAGVAVTHCRGVEDQGDYRVLQVQADMSMQHQDHGDLQAHADITQQHSTAQHSTAQHSNAQQCSTLQGDMRGHTASCKQATAWNAKAQ